MMFTPPDAVHRAAENASEHAWAAAQRKRMIDDAQWWAGRSDDELWSLMFGPKLPRAWQVWSDGSCPSCDEAVPMYEWKIDALHHPWKAQCPHCQRRLPDNDFKAYHDSGLDERGWFDPQRADAALLVSQVEGGLIDDGHGAVVGDKRWRFIATYLVYGQWKQLIVGGINKLAAAYVTTGEQVYAHKAAVMLDRVADVYPDFDYWTQAWMYEQPASEANCNGFVSTWHDACEETRELVLAYDYIREAIDQDIELVAFLVNKSGRFKTSVVKTGAADIHRNIRERIAEEALAQPKKIHSNYPRSPIAQAVMHMTLGGDDHMQAAQLLIDEMVERSTRVDGVTGEKGLAGYSAYVIQGLATFLAQLDRAQPGALKALVGKYPNLARTYRFHIDTRCLGRYYPAIGDTDWFARPVDSYVGMQLPESFGVYPSTYELLWKLYELTGDAAYVQVLYAANGGKVNGLPHDLFCEDVRAFEEQVTNVIDAKGTQPTLGSIDLKDWHLAILRSGKGNNARAAWLDYDAGGAHAHGDGMNLGLYAKGLDLMPDFGYPPVQFGGWGSVKARWYLKTAAHNSVTVDGQDQCHDWRAPVGGRTTLWIDQPNCRVMRAAGAELYNAYATLDPDGEHPQLSQYERTVIMVDIDDDDFYLLDIFRVVGGREHARYMHSHFGDIATQGVTLRIDAQPFGQGVLMRNRRTDATPSAGWSVDWQVRDVRGYSTAGFDDVHMRYTDLTVDEGVTMSLCEGWITPGGYKGSEQQWIPRVITSHAGEGPLVTTFVAVIEPYAATRRIQRITRLPLVSKSGDVMTSVNVAVEVTLADGRRDLLAALDGNEAAARQAAWDVNVTGAVTVLRHDGPSLSRLT